MSAPTTPITDVANAPAKPDESWPGYGSWKLYSKELERRLAAANALLAEAQTRIAQLESKMDAPR